MLNNTLAILLYLLKVAQVLSSISRQRRVLILVGIIRESTLFTKVEALKLFKPLELLDKALSGIVSLSSNLLPSLIRVRTKVLAYFELNLRISLQASSDKGIANRTKTIELNSSRERVQRKTIADQVTRRSCLQYSYIAICLRKIITSTSNRNL